jgi:plasmid rolling circle replication initiator protein Rep
MITQQPEILEEFSFRKHKMRTIPIAKKYAKFSTKKANKIEECGDALWFNLKEHKTTSEWKLFLENMFTCKDRFCPFCNWRRMMKYSKMIYKHIRELEEKKKLRYIFLTLTVKNCELSELRTTIQLMQKSFERMSKTVKFKKSVVGFLRVLEFTREKGAKDVFHPHFHILLVVEPSYFNPRYDKYIKTSGWSEMWKKALGVSYSPVCDVKIVRQNKNETKDANASVVAEMCKYPMKDTDIESVEDFEELTNQLKNIRNINAGGILKGILKSEKEIDDDLVHIDEENRDDLWVLLAKVLYKFEVRKNKSNYYYSGALSADVGKDIKKD